MGSLDMGVIFNIAMVLGAGFASFIVIKYSVKSLDKKVADLEVWKKEHEQRHTADVEKRQEKDKAFSDSVTDLRKDVLTSLAKIDTVISLLTEGKLKL